MRKILKIILAFIARCVLLRYEPLVIGVTGSVGKTSTKDAIAEVLERLPRLGKAGKFNIRKSLGTLNDEIGVPLAVLGITPAGTHLKKATWASRWRLILGVLSAFWLAFGFRTKKYPKILVLEIGADKPGDIFRITELVKPKIAVVMAVGDIPAHVEFYPDAEVVALEKAKILKYAKPPIGISILNLD